ncbi:hypothetical protein VKT23_001917 [Stygiomarasmius scandens]|uniref:Uncharacterized protein n=1 Tax=Marasmiellus scandens TaxID=2682957 RepID=A0ABR1K6I3_9AGAR
MTAKQTPCDVFALLSISETYTPRRDTPSSLEEQSGYETDDEFSPSYPITVETLRLPLGYQVPSQPNLQPVQNLPSPPLIVLPSPSIRVTKQPRHTSQDFLIPVVPADHLDFELSPGGTLYPVIHKADANDDSPIPLRTPFHPTFKLSGSPFASPHPQPRPLPSATLVNKPISTSSYYSSPYRSLNFQPSLHCISESPTSPHPASILGIGNPHSVRSDFQNRRCASGPIDRNSSVAFPDFLRGLPKFKLPASPLEEVPLSPSSPHVCSPLKSPFLIREHDGGYFTCVSSS